MTTPVVWYAHADYMVVTAVIPTDAAADQIFPLFRVPRACELYRAYVTMTDAVAANASNWVKCSLYNGGTSIGTATTVISGTAGGTAGWSALVPVAMTPTVKALVAGDIVTLNYNENGTVTPGIPMVVTLELMMHKGQETVRAEIATAKTAIDTLKTSIDLLINDEVVYLGDTRQYHRGLSAELDKKSRRLGGDRTEAGIRVIDRPV